MNNSDNIPVLHAISAMKQAAYVLNEGNWPTMTAKNLLVSLRIAQTNITKARKILKEMK